MKIIDLFTGSKQEITLRIKPALKSEEFQQQNISNLKVTYTSERYWLVYDENQRIEIDGIGPEDKSNLELVCLEQSIVYVFESHSRKMTLKVRLFNEKIKLSESTEIGFGDIILDDIDKRYSRQVKDNDKIKWLKEELLVKSGTDVFSLISNSPGENGFRIFGKKISVDIIRQNNKFEISRIVNKNPKHAPTIILVADLRIKDISRTAEIKTETFLVLGKLDKNEKYLNTWKKYQKIEREITRKKQEDIGYLKIKNIKPIGFRKYKLSYKDDKNSSNWLKEILKDDLIELTTERSFDDGQQKVKVVEKGHDYIVITSKEDLFDNAVKNIPKFQFAIWSTVGDEILQKRRDIALGLLGKNNAPLPQLSAILEGIPTATREFRKINPITPKVKREFGEFGPNSLQEEALRIALNTPDIAIIQGPPGTGKTKVISALAKRIAEDARVNNRSFEKEILLTAFQHDAVDNMVDRTTVLGLPAIKYGKKNSQVDTIGKWIKETIEKVESEQYGIEPNDYEFQYREMKEHYLKYIETLDRGNAIAYLIRFKDENFSNIPMEIVSEISQLNKSGFTQNSETIQILESFVRNIRTDIKSYEDDGLFNLKRFLRKYRLYIIEENIPELTTENIVFMEKMCEISLPSDEELASLDEIKIDYLDKLVSGVMVINIHLGSIEIENIFVSLLNHFSQEIKRNGSVYTVLSEYIYDLQSNDDTVRATIELYSALLASTIQGTKSKKMMLAKSDPFNTVIVDEAARANPLDLLIPMTSAKRRIVLVGDHRQLPHIVDDSIQNSLSEDKDIAKEYISHLEDSLFERLLQNVKKLEEKDGIRRFVTLDTQYRMHPVLGSFISKTFYEKEGDPQIESGTSAENLTHSLEKYINKVAVSIDVSSKRSKEVRYRGSLYRPIEAQEAIKIAKEILDEDQTLSVGVITFYRKQVDELFFEAERVNLVEKDDESKFKVVKNYELTPDKEERFRIGTVDAFQGKEFDVVILSLVRSNSNATIRGKYGFLTSYNRLNVAMSRAKKLLITIGDADMFMGEDAKKSVYGLYAFYKELIGSEYGTNFRL